jgi:aryl-alcohol dehydrogenase-like predicted oxidoreductase
MHLSFYSGWPGTTKLSRLEENLGAASLKFAPEDLADLEEAASRIEVVPENWTGS